MSNLDTEIICVLFINLYLFLDWLKLQRKLLKMLNYCNTGVPVSRYSIENVYQGKSFIYGSAHEKDQMYPKKKMSVWPYMEPHESMFFRRRNIWWKHTSNIR